MRSTTSRGRMARVAPPVSDFAPVSTPCQQLFVLPLHRDPSKLLCTQNRSATNATATSITTLTIRPVHQLPAPLTTATCHPDVSNSFGSPPACRIRASLDKNNDSFCCRETGRSFSCTSCCFAPRDDHHHALPFTNPAPLSTTITTVHIDSAPVPVLFGSPPAYLWILLPRPFLSTNDYCEAITRDIPVPPPTLIPAVLYDCYYVPFPRPSCQTSVFVLALTYINFLRVPRVSDRAPSNRRFPN